MAESFLAIVADKILGQIFSLVGQEIAVPWGLKSDLKKLQNTLKIVKAVILDVQERQFTSQEVCIWLGQLKELLFDAEDLFDEFEYEVLRKQVINSTHGCIRRKVRCILSMSSNPITFSLGMRRKVREIRKAFDEVAANKAKYHFNTNLGAPNNSTLLLCQRELTHSFVNASQIIGRDKDRDTIVHALVDSQSLNESVSVVSIVGIGGMGKTALAKLIFNDSTVVDHFERMVWVCLGDLSEFSVCQVMVKIVKSILGKKNIELDPEQLQSCLRDNLRDKRFLLVLDDVWNVDRAKWFDLRELIKCGADGSKVMVTTRTSSVASNMSSVVTHNLEGLSHVESVFLFKKFAFEEGGDDQNLMAVGDAIVGKCKGVPLAIKTVGCLLFPKRKIGEWEFVRDSELWQLEQKKDDILPALKISYAQLPFILKQCFVFCAIFPKDYGFNSIELIHHWSACGLLASNKKPDEIGQQYINQLLVRGFFQDFNDFSTLTAFKMHDLVHDLALSVAQNEMKNMESSQDILKSVRYVSFSKQDSSSGEKVAKLFLKKNLISRCVMPTTWSVVFDQVREGERGSGDSGELVKTCISKMKHMRILNLSSTPHLEKLPHSIGALKHLRYLDLDGCKRLKRLPDSFCQLYNLQFLSLLKCKGLEELPKDMRNLLNLRTFGITVKQKRFSVAGGNGVGSLSSLEHMALESCEKLEYVFDDVEETSSQLLASLRTLMMGGCKSLTSIFSLASSSTPNMKLREFSNLHTLWICYCPNFQLSSVHNNQLSLSNIKFLVLAGLPQMEELPEWIRPQGCATTLETLAIGQCLNLTSLPEWLHRLTSLRILSIVGCPKLLCLPQRLGSLQELKIRACPELSKRCTRETGEDWPKIKHIPKIVLLDAEEDD